MTAVKEYTRLTCDCGSELFRQVIALTWRDGGGTVTQPIGWECQACNAVMDAAHMIQRLQLRVKKQELLALQQEIGEGPVIPRYRGTQVDAAAAREAKKALDEAEAKKAAGVL